MFFLELSCFFDDPMDVGNLISGSSAFSKTSLNIWKFMVHVLLKPGLENFEHYFTSVRWVQLCSSLSILWHCLSQGLEWTWLLMDQTISRIIHFKKKVKLNSLEATWSSDVCNSEAEKGRGCSHYNNLFLGKFWGVFSYISIYELTDGHVH